MQENNFKGYKISFSSQAKKTLEKMDSTLAGRINRKIQDLVNGKPNVDVKKMVESGLRYRLRCGEYRIVFDVKREIITVLVIRIGHRSSIYQGL